MAKTLIHGIMRDLDAEQAQYEAREKRIELARGAEIERICARYELESDEFQTREEKARILIANHGPSFRGLSTWFDKP